jgi:hypothetical protein
MPALTNTKAEACAQLLAKGGIAEHAAYAKAFGTSKKSAQGNASAAIEKYGIHARVAELQAQAAETFSLSRATWLESLARIAKKAEAEKDYTAARGCLREIGLAMPKWYAPSGTDGLATDVAELIKRLIRPGSPIDRMGGVSVVKGIENW